MASPRMQRFQYQRAGNQPNEPWFRLGPVDATTTTIVTALCVLSFFVYAINSDWLIDLSLFPSKVYRGQLWRIVTWPFANEPSLSVAVSVAVLWICGTNIERTLGRRRFLAFLSAVLFIPTSLLLIFGIAEGGIRALSFALFVGFAVQNPEARWFFGIKIWVIASVYVGLEVLRMLGDRTFHELWVFLVSLLVVITGLRAFGEAERLAMFPKLPLLDRVGISKRKANTTTAKATKSAKNADTNSNKSSKSSKNSKNTGSPTGSKVVAGPWPSGGISQFEVDRLLEKIGKTGIDSLSAEERATLDRASKNLRDRRNE